MPCKDPTPTRREERAAKVLKLITTFKDQGEDIELPKGFNGDVSGFGIFGSDEYLDEATDILCEFCQRKDEDFIYNGRFKERRRLADWWDEHKEIDSQEGRINTLMKWISVKNDMPKEGDLILLKTVYADISATQYYIGQFIFGDFRAVDGYGNVDYFDPKENHITHWMKIPE